MAERIIISEVNFKNNYFNIKASDGREVSVSTINKDGSPANPTLKAALEQATSGTEVEVEIKEWVNPQGVKKLFGNDPKKSGAGFGAKTFAPKDKGFDAAICAANAAAAFYAFDKEKSGDKLIATAELLHSWLMLKVSK